MKARCTGVLAVVVVASPALGGEATSRPSRGTIFNRLSLAQLQRFDRDRAALAQKVKRVAVPYPFVRGTFHMHSELSHDSSGKIPEIIAAAKATGTRIVGFTEHPRRDVDVIKANVKGWKDGIYFLSGVESGGVRSEGERHRAHRHDPVQLRSLRAKHASRRHVSSDH